MHIQSKNYDFLMYTLNAGKPVPSYIPSTTVRGDTLLNRCTTIINYRALIVFLQSHMTQNVILRCYPSVSAIL